MPRRSSGCSRTETPGGPTSGSRRRVWCGLLLLLAIATPISVGPAAYGEPPTAAWRVTTSNFTLYTTAPALRAELEARELATFRNAVATLLGRELPSGFPTRVFALEAADWRRFGAARPGLGGWFSGRAFAADLVIAASTGRSQSRELMFHEYTHHLLRSLRPEGHPVFFDEGLAEALAVASFTRDRVRITPRADHLQLLRRTDWLPFDRLVAINRRDREYLDPTMARLFYAQSWAVVYFALANRTADERRVIRFMRLLDAGEPVAAAAPVLVQAGGGMDENAEVRRFLFSRGGLAPLDLGDDDAAPPAARAAPTDADDYRVALGLLLLRVGNRAAEALQVLAELSDAREPVGSTARAGAAMAYLQLGRSVEADSAALELLATPRPLSPEAAVLLGRVIYRLALQPSSPSRGPADERVAENERRQPTHDPPRLERARQLFETALDAPGVWMEATQGFVATSLALGRHDGALLARAQRALQQAPASIELSMDVAQLLDLAGRPNEALQHWVTAARLLPAGPVRSQVQQRIDALVRDGGVALGKDEPAPIDAAR
jgi:Flp pilus assembly protein TadD